MTPRMEQAVQRVLAAMNEAVEAGQPMSIKDMAKVAGCSPFHLCRAFRAATGQSPVAYLTGLRYERAAQLLATTDLTLRGVCRRVGYLSVGTFAVRFRRRFGVPQKSATATVHFDRATDPFTTSAAITRAVESLPMVALLCKKIIAHAETHPEEVRSG